MRYSLRGIVVLVMLFTVVFVGSVASVDARARKENDKFEHIFYIMMENHATNQIFGNTSDAPYLNKLVSKYASANKYYGVTHPSLPNYLAAISGDFQGIWDDCKAGADVKCAPQEFGPTSGYTNGKELLTPAQIASATNKAHWFNERTIVDQLENHGLSWKTYMQSMPYTGYTGEYYPYATVNGQSTPLKLYAQKHNPFDYFTTVRNSSARMNKVVPFTRFDKDLNSGHVPNFVWISPDQCNDMHGVSAANAKLLNIPDCASPASGLDHSIIKRGDDFIKKTVEQITSSRAWKEKSAIVIVWDENDYSSYESCCHSPKGVNGVTLGGSNAPFLVVTSKGAHHLVDDSTPYNHYTLLATIEKLWNLGCLENACGFKDSSLMTKFFA
jgi:phosphatidylinositol-3-phosphatase